MNLSFSHENSVNVRHFYANQQQALIQNLEIKPNIITYNFPHKTLKIKMDMRLHYSFVIMDPKLNFITISSPDLFPRSFINWKTQGEEGLLLYMKVDNNVNPFIDKFKKCQQYHYNMCNNYWLLKRQ